jgi:hypothetical protein
MKTKFIPLLIVLMSVVASCKLENEKTADSSTENTESTSKTTGTGFKISFNAIVDKDDAFQIFYNEDGTEGFTGDQMVNLKIKGSTEAQTIEFVLPDDANPLNLRFDIGSNKELKQVKFNGFKMSFKGNAFSAESPEFFKYFYPNEQVSCDTINAIAKNIGKEGKDYDPIIGGTLYLRNEIEKLYKK